MKFMCWNMRVRWLHGAAGLLLISFLAGCNRAQDKVYRIPKDDSAPSEPASPSAPASAPEVPPPNAPPDMSAIPPAAPSLPQLKYQLPEGWQEKSPSEMRVASFTALGPNGQSADIGVVPLPVVGRDLELVNMWRSQVQLPATSDPNAVNLAEPVAIGGEQGRLFGFVSDQPTNGKSRQRIFVAMLTRGDMSWFFKMAGEDVFVASQKEKFIQFLKSVSFPDNVPATMAAVPPTNDDSPSSIWAVPSGWQPMPPAQFLLAEFSVPGAGGAKAEVNVAELDGEGGGTLANINRWRGQIGLGPVEGRDLPPATPVPGGQSTLVDFTGVDAKTGAPTRLVGAIVALNGQAWFYKLMGDPQIVAQQKDAFTKFIQSANYANAR
jgi:hypothetical protein